MAPAKRFGGNFLQQTPETGADDNEKNGHGKNHLNKPEHHSF